MPIANRSTSVRAKPTGLGQRSGDGVYDRGSNVAGPRADGGEQESLLTERRELGNNLGERKVESAWPGKATGRDTVNATISMRTGFLVGTGVPRSSASGRMSSTCSISTALIPACQSKMWRVGGRDFARKAKGRNADLHRPVARPLPRHPNERPVRGLLPDHTHR